MIQAYKEGKDLYCVIAQKIFNNSYEENLEFYPAGTEIEVDGKKVICGNKTHINKAGKSRRKTAKTIQLALCYGMGVGTLAQRLNKTPQESKELMDSFFNSFPKVKQAIDGSKQYLKEHGYVEDWAGRRRHLPDYFLKPYEAVYADSSKLTELQFNPFLECQDREVLDTQLQYYLNKAAETKNNTTFKKLAQEAAATKDKNGNPKDSIILTANTGRIAQAERQCFNARIQGGAASLTKLAMVNIENNERLKELDAHLIITVHDEVLVECPALYADEVEQLLPKIMIDTAKPYINVPMSCDPYNVSRWYCDEAAVVIRNEFEKLEHGDSDNGKPGLNREAAIAKVIANHPEIPEKAIQDAIELGSDLEF